MNNIRNIRAKDFQILNYLSVKKTHLISFVLFPLCLSYTVLGFGQTPGMVIKPAFTPNNAVNGIPGFHAESLTQLNLNVSAYNVKGITSRFAQLCAQCAQFTLLIIPLYKIGKSTLNIVNLTS